jgi:predicted patatin/cPLA2 family phospholipase
MHSFVSFYPIPVRKALVDGNEKLLIVLTRPVGYEKTLSRGNRIAARILKHKYPQLVEPLLTRHLKYNETVRFCEQLEQQGKAIVLRPAEDGIIESFEKDLNKIEASYQYGYVLAQRRMPEIAALF